MLNFRRTTKSIEAKDGQVIAPLTKLDVMPYPDDGWRIAFWIAIGCAVWPLLLRPSSFSPPALLIGPRRLFQPLFSLSSSWRRPACRACVRQAVGSFV